MTIPFIPFSIWEFELIRGNLIIFAFFPRCSPHRGPRLRRVHREARPGGRDLQAIGDRIKHQGAQVSLPNTRSFIFF